MKCGTCKDSFGTYRKLKNHWRKTGCNWNRKTWEKVAASKKKGHSGRRILSAAYPDLYKRVPMSEETKARLQELAAKRQGMKVTLGRRK